MSGRDERIWVVIHICMVKIQGLSLCSHIYLKLAKLPCSPYFFYVFFFYKIIAQDGVTGSAWWWVLDWGCGEVGRKMAQKMYTHVSKCKNIFCIVTEPRSPWERESSI
jgi:hypothetical protein